MRSTVACTNAAKLFATFALVASARAVAGIGTFGACTDITTTVVTP